MRSPRINGEGELRGQPANRGSPDKMAVKMECVCVCIDGYSDESFTDTILLWLRMKCIILENIIN